MGFRSPSLFGTWNRVDRYQVRTINNTSNRMNASQIVELLKVRYHLPEFALVTQVPDGTSVNKSRTCDAIAVGCWKSAGIKVHGFEIKVSRSDWRKEMQDRDKAAVFERHCHHWWIVAPKGIVQLDELPSTWGLIVASETKLTTAKPSDLRVAEPIDAAFLAGFLRRALDQNGRESEVESAYRRGHTDGWKEGQKRLEKSNLEQQLIDQLGALGKRISDFEERSGIRIDLYDSGKCGEQFAAFKRLIGDTDNWQSKQAIKWARQLAEDAAALVAFADANPLAAESEPVQMSA